MPTTWPVFSWSSLRDSVASSLCMILAACGPKIFQSPSTFTADSVLSSPAARPGWASVVGAVIESASFSAGRSASERPSVVTPLRGSPGGWSGMPSRYR